MLPDQPPPLRQFPQRRHQPHMQSLCQPQRLTQKQLRPLMLNQLQPRLQHLHQPQLQRQVNKSWRVQLKVYA